MIIRVENLESRMMGIYKINYPNNKIYIGLSNDIKRRMWEHNNPLHSGREKPSQVCDMAILKYGKITEIEILEQIDDINELEKREKYWINFYNSTNRNIGYNIANGGIALYGANNPQSKYTDDQVLDIRKRRFLGERKIEVYNKYYKDCNFSSFEKIWLGIGYPQIGEEYIILPNTKSRSELAKDKGVDSYKAKLTEEQILEIRRRYDSGEMQKEIHKDFSFVGKTTIQRVCVRDTYVGTENR